MSSSEQPSSLFKAMSQQDREAGKLAIRLANATVRPMVLQSAVELHNIDLISRDTSEVDGACLSPSETAARIPTKSPDAQDAASF